MQYFTHEHYGYAIECIVVESVVWSIECNKQRMREKTNHYYLFLFYFARVQWRN